MFGYHASLFAPASLRQPLCASLFSTLVSLVLTLIGALACSADSLSWDSGKQGAFVTALCADHQGRVFTATEGSGLWRYDPAAPDKRYTHFTQKDGLGSDDVYALTVDANNRLWAGTLRGVSVFNGKDWKTYGPLEGLAGSRVFALAVCPTDHSVWVATEGGLSRWIPRQDRWLTYSRLDGLPSDALSCLAFNKSGDVFVGTQADGIAFAKAVGGYKQWRVIPGPKETPHLAGGAGLPTGLVNCLLVSRTGTVYAGTDDGLARSEDGGKSWRFLRGVDWKAKSEGNGAALVDNADVRALEVLPLDDPAGRAVRINAGGKASGVYLADADFDGGRTFPSNAPVDTKAVPDPAPQDVYRTARQGSFTYTIPDLHPNARYKVRLHLAEVTLTKKGRRVFSVLVNGQPALTDFDIFAEAGGRNKALVREFEARADGVGQLTLTFQGASALPSRENSYALAEDYITCLSEDGAGHLLVGHRQQGLEAFDLKTGARLPDAGKGSPAAFVTALLPRPDGTVLVGGYGTGLTQTPLPNEAGSDVPISSIASAPDDKPAPLPSPAKPPTLAELNALLKTLSAVRPDPNEMQPKAVALDDDWQTEGDWLGRYGRYWACFPAFDSPNDYYWGAGWQPVGYAPRVGPNGRPREALRYWIQTVYTNEAHCLEIPPTYLDSMIKVGITDGKKPREDSSQDDHGETYPTTVDGPHIYQNLTIPPGLFYLSLYFFNRRRAGGGNVAESGNNDRDYRLSVRLHPEGAPLRDISSFTSEPELAHGRVAQYSAGVWKRFLVRGPTALTIQVDRNNSFNTELNGIMLDLVDERPAPYFQTVAPWQARQSVQAKVRQALLTATPQAHARRFSAGRTEREAANRLFGALGQVRLTNSAWWGENGRRFYGPLLRWYQSQEGSTSPNATLASRLGTCYYQMAMYPDWERCQVQAGLTPARRIEKHLKWTGTDLTVTDSGQGYRVVTNYLQGNKAKKENPKPDANHRHNDAAAAVRRASTTHQ